MCDVWRGEEIKASNDRNPVQINKKNQHTKCSIEEKTTTNVYKIHRHRAAQTVTPFHAIFALHFTYNMSHIKWCHYIFD